MPRPVVVDAQPAFSGGLNVTADPSQLEPTQVRQAINGRLSEYGGVGKRLGTVRLSVDPIADGQPIQNGFTWYRPTSTQLLVVANGTLSTAEFITPAVAQQMVTEAEDYLATEGNEILVTSSPVTEFVDEGGTLSDTVPPAFASFLYTDPTDTECVYIADGGPLNRWDGTDLDENLANTPSVKQIRVYNQRLYGVSGSDQTIWWSGLNNGDSLGVGNDGGGSAIIRTFGDQKITGLAVSGGSLLLFHVSGISKFTGFTQDDIAIAAGATGITGEVGTTAPFSIVEVSGNVYFLGPNGFYVVNESQAPVSISTPIDSLVRGWDDNVVQGVRGVHARRFQEVRWWIPNYGVLVYNYRLNAWTGPWTGGYLSPVTTCLFESQDVDGKYTVMRGDTEGWVTLSDAANAYRDNLDTDYENGTAFNLVTQPHRFFAGDFMAEKAYRWGYVLIDPRGTDDVTVAWETQSGSGSYSLDPDQLTATDRAMFRVPMGDRGEWVDVTITDAGEADALYSRVEVQGFNMGRRGGT